MGCHYPDYSDIYSSQCFPSGKTSETDIYKYGYIKHFIFKTAEELCSKINKGDVEHTGYYNTEKRIELIDEFFALNKVTLEKIEVIEKCINKTLLNWRNKLKTL